MLPGAVTRGRAGDLTPPSATATRSHRPPPSWTQCATHSPNSAMMAKRAFQGACLSGREAACGGWCRGRAAEPPKHRQWRMHCAPPLCPTQQRPHPGRGWVYWDAWCPAGLLPCWAAFHWVM